MKPKTTTPETRDTGPLERRGWLADVADICNSELGQGIGVAAMAVGVALMMLAFGLGIGGCTYLERIGQAQVEKSRVKE